MIILILLGISVFALIAGLAIMDWKDDIRVSDEVEKQKNLTQDKRG